MNDHYIAIKVDREQRPDIDAVYMHARRDADRQRRLADERVAHARAETVLRRHVLSTARRRARRAQGFPHASCASSTERFEADPGGVAAEARALAGARAAVDGPGQRRWTAGARARSTHAVATAAARYDRANGGARGAPKFPSSFPVRLLLRQWRRTGDEHAREMALSRCARWPRAACTTRSAAASIATPPTRAGWCRTSRRCSTTRPRLAVAYLEGYQASGDADLARVARETLDYVARDMTAPGGGFYSATDADSRAPGGRQEEGYYFTWTPAEVEAAVGAERARVVDAYFDVTPAGNFHGRSILHTAQSRDAVAASLGSTRHQLDATLAEAIPLLRAARDKRAPPFRDEKIQASWNGLMIGAFARGARVLDEPRYQEIATRAARFLLDKLRPGGRLHHSFYDGHVGPVAFLDDQAFLASGLLDLFELTSDTRWLDAAISLMSELETRFADGAHGGYFQTPADAERLLARDKPAYDGPTPSGNSVALMDPAPAGRADDRRHVARARRDDTARVRYDLDPAAVRARPDAARRRLPPRRAEGGRHRAAGQERRREGRRDAARRAPHYLCAGPRAGRRARSAPRRRSRPARAVGEGQAGEGRPRAGLRVPPRCL